MVIMWEIEKPKGKSGEREREKRFVGLPVKLLRTQSSPAELTW